MRVLNSLAALAAGLALGAGAMGVASAAGTLNREGIQHVLLISIDGMHAVDFVNCTHGVGAVNNGAPYCPHLATLKEHGVNYLETSTSKPSDSFPGLMSIISGGSPRTLGVFYDVAYDRSLAPPATTTGNGLSGAPGLCTPGTFNGTTTEYEEGIDRDQTYLNGISVVTLDAGGFVTNGADGGLSSIDPMKLPRDPAQNCAPVYPWNFIRINTVFGVIHAAGGYTAWSDKHPAYSSVSGPNRGAGPANVPENLDDFYAPEINSVPIPLPFPGCSAADDANFANLGSYTDSFGFTRCYDTLKVKGVLNQIDGYTHNRGARARVPTIFGMNFQAVSVGQKLIEPRAGPGGSTLSGGYTDANGTPSAALLSQIQFVDEAIGQFVAELRKQGLSDTTLLIITGKHGQSPIDTARYTRISANGAVTTSPSQIVDACLPDSESNAGNQIGPTEDDVSLLWLKSGCNAADEVALLEQQSPAANNVAGIGQIFSGLALTQFLNAPGLPPKDPRTPDIIITPNIGVTYSGSTKKHAEHGGFAHDDLNVMLLAAHPSLGKRTVTGPVGTNQVAPTILEALGLSPASLQGVQLEGTQALPGLSFGD